MVAYPPAVPAFLPLFAHRNQLRLLNFKSEMGVWEDFPHNTAHTRTPYARACVYVIILPYSQKGIESIIKEGLAMPVASGRSSRPGRMAA